MNNVLSRRRFLVDGMLGAGMLALGGCDPLEQNADTDAVLQSAETLTMRAQRLLLRHRPLAREFSAADISPTFRVNGTQAPDSEEYAALRESGFADWTLKVGGLVDRPLALSLADLKKLPSRTQITRHDCVEGWSAIGEWTGPQLSHLLDLAQVTRDANFIVFHCADELGGVPYYESVDMVDAYHPQTIIAHRLNGEPLPVRNGAPLRLRVERQLGYKHAKYLTGIEAVASLDRVGGGNGGYWEDRGYQWYAGI